MEHFWIDEDDKKSEEKNGKKNKIMSSHKMRRFLMVVCICFIAFTNIDCRQGDRPRADKSTVTVLSTFDEWALGPAADQVAKFLVFLEMATPNEHGQLEGRLARSWEHSADYKTWTIHLRTNVRWHDGVPVTAHDIKFTVDLWKHPDVQHWEGAPIESVTVLDDSTITIVYKKPPVWDFYWLPGYWSVYYPKHLLENLDPTEFYEWEFWTRPVGNGPYRFVRHVPKTMMEFEANPDYFRGKPRIERVVFKFGRQSLTELLAGNVDALNLGRQIDVRSVIEDPRFRTYYEVWDDIGALQVILWNQRHPALRDPRIRRALTLAINRPELPRVLYMSEDLPIVDAPYTDRQYWRRELPEPLPFDPEQAKRLLDQAGWRDRDGDGVREREAEELTFSTIVNAEWTPAAVYVQENLRRVGVRMEITTLDGSVVRERVREGAFEAAIHYIWTMPAVERGLLQMFGENSPLGFSNARVIELLEAAQLTMDPDEKDAIYRELTPIFQAELPMTFLTLEVETYVAHRRIKGFSTPFRANPTRAMEYLWIEDED